MEQTLYIKNNYDPDAFIAGLCRYNLNQYIYIFF